MAWLRLDDGFTEHRKVVALKRADRWTWLELLTYCARQSNGGHVPQGVCDVLRWVTPKFLTRCAELGLLDVMEDGYRVHDWNVYNPKDATAAERMQRHRARNANRNDGVTPTVTEPVTQASRDRDSRVAARARPVPSPEEQEPSVSLEPHVAHRQPDGPEQIRTIFTRLGQEPT